MLVRVQLENLPFFEALASDVRIKAIALLTDGDMNIKEFAQAIWFSSGFVEYSIPKYLSPNQYVDEIEISFEILSEAPGFHDEWPSDIHTIRSPAEKSLTHTSLF